MIGIVGTGVMAKGIALQAALSGQEVILVGRDAKKADACLAAINEQLALLAERHAHVASVQEQSIRPEIRSTLDYADLAACEAVIETVSEDISIKRSVLQQSERHIADDCLLLTCTSSISISELAKGLRNPGLFIGMHFFNPANIMPLVEIVPHGCTEADTIGRANGLATRLGKRSIIVRDSPGFFVNRVLFAYIQGFCTVLMEVGDHKKVDDIMVKNGWPMGPAALLDAIGTDTCFDIGWILVRAFPEFFSTAFVPVLEPLVNLGWTGKKNGIGFYRYSHSGSGVLVQEVNGEAVVLLNELRKGVARRDVSDEEVVDRLMLPVTNEVFRCIEEGVISSQEEADQAIFLSMGYGRRGGVCKQLKKTGIDAHIAKCGKYSSLGEIYRPPASLLALAK